MESSCVYEHKELEILYSFLHNVDYRIKMSKKPNEIHYIPLRKDLKEVMRVCMLRHTTSHWGSTQFCTVTVKGFIIRIQDEKGNLLKK